MSSDWTRGRRGGAPDDRDRDQRPREGGFRQREDRADFRRDDEPRRERRQDDQQGWRPFQSPRPRDDERSGGFREGGRPFHRDRPRSFEGEGDRPAFRDRPRFPGGGDQRPPFQERPREGRPFGRDFTDRDERPGRFNRPDDRPFRRDQGGDDRPTYRQGRGGYRPFDREGRDDRPPFRDRPFERGGRPFEREERGDRPGYARRGSDDRPRFGGQRQEQGGFRRYERESSFEGQGRPWGARPDRGAAGQFERIQADVYGRWPVLESLRAGNVTKVYLAAGVRETADHLREIQTVAAERHIPVVRVDRFALDKVLGNANHQGIAAACRPYQYAGFEDVLAEAKEAEGKPLVVLFDGVQDPQNLGSILRTAEAVGADGAVLPKHNQVGVTPAVVRASAGAVEHLPIAEVANLRQAIDRLKDAGYWIVGLDMEGGTDYDNFDVDSPIALVIGGEGKGISRIVADNCDYLVRLPMRGQVGSLNASVSAGIVMYEIDRRRGGDRERTHRRARKPGHSIAEAEGAGSRAAPASDDDELDDELDELDDIDEMDEVDEEMTELGDPEHDVAVYAGDAGDDLAEASAQPQPGKQDHTPSRQEQAEAARPVQPDSIPDGSNHTPATPDRVPDKPEQAETAQPATEEKASTQEARQDQKPPDQQ